MPDIYTGVYRLTVDMPAIHPDKRVRGDWRAAPMKAGTLFAVRDEAYDYADPETSPRALYIAKLGHWAHQRVLLTRAGASFLENLVHVDGYTASQYLAYLDRTSEAPRILDLLMEKGLLTPHGIDGLLAEIDEKDKETD